MQHTIFNLILHFVLSTTGLSAVIIGCVQAKRTVREGVDREIELRRQLTAHVTAA